MSNNVTVFFVILIVNFLVLGSLNVVFEYFDTGDDPLYSLKVAVQNFIVSLFMAVTMVWLNNKKIRGRDQDGS